MCRYEKSIQGDVRNRIINLIDSASMRMYWYEHKDELSIYDFVEIIAGAPTRQEKKKKLLIALSEVRMDEEEQEYVKHCMEWISEALEKLYAVDYENTRMVLRCIDTENNKGFVMDAVPVLSYGDVLSYIRQEYGIVKNVKCLDYYFCVDLYEVTQAKELVWKYEYICDGKGEVQYLERKDEKKDVANRLFHGEAMDHFPVSYSVGDILQIDCRPYMQPKYCLIYYISDNRRDCCGTRCLYLTDKNLIQEGALKHGHYCSLESDGQYVHRISPLYRAEICQGVPEELRALESISRDLKEDTSLTDAIDQFFLHRDGGVTKEELLRYINRYCAKRIYKKYEKLMHRLADR